MVFTVWFDYDKSHQENQTQPLKKETSHVEKLKRQRLGFCNCQLNRKAWEKRGIKYYTEFYRQLSSN